MHFDALDIRELLGDELIERQESGYALDGLGTTVRAALEDSQVSTGAIEDLYDQLDDTRLRPGWTYEEPSELEEILAAAPGAELLGRPAASVLRDRVQAAWLGRCAGCNLGKPVEGGWGREKLRRYLDLAGAYPLDDYVPALDPLPGEFTLHPSWRDATRGHVQGMARDDDTDYTMLALRILEKYGRNFTSADVGTEWLLALPFHMVYTAERVAYRNLIYGMAPPATATYHNPYREWIGALIRGDMFGYVSPGDPGAAARLAFQDAALSHIANGIYGEMWSAALVAAAFSAQSARDALEAAQRVVPGRSRLAEALRTTIDAYSRGASWDDAMASMERRLAGYHWVHTINNAEVVAAALLWGAGDFSRTIGLAVEAGLDTDCTGATAGSVFGALHGTEALPGHWVGPLENEMHSAIFGFEGVRITDLVDRTLKVGEAIA
ncbi:MAG TPA: ADP-ribosylglycohydrolase family protein [Acidimicrobiales bacterium]|nr:ADP-ribosylglycohydrolase family protein [Acidimicrobiales bacterium]